MILLLILGLLLAPTAPAAAMPDDGDEWRRVVDLRGTWKFQLGDDIDWAEPKLSDKDWETIFVPARWEEEGYWGYDGYAWYRIRFPISKGVQDDPGFQQYRSLRLLLGKIDDVDQTWFNGRVVGQTGAFPDAFETAWRTQRAYILPEDLIRWGADNVLAIRQDNDDLFGFIVTERNTLAEGLRLRNHPEAPDHALGRVGSAIVVRSHLGDLVEDIGFHIGQRQNRSGAGFVWTLG